MSVLVEACVDSVASARRAIAEGAGRLELCAALRAGGTTPAMGLLRAVREQAMLPLHALILPRAGVFHYTGAEVRQLEREVAEARGIGVDGVVLGALDREGRVDLATMQRLRDTAGPLAITFHRAFDRLSEPERGLETLIELGISRLLTSGQAANALAGIPQLAALVRQARGRIGILAGGTIRAENAIQIVRETGVREIHVGAGDDAEVGRVRDVLKSVNSEQ